MSHFKLVVNEFVGQPADCEASRHPQMAPLIEEPTAVGFVLWLVLAGCIAWGLVLFGNSASNASIHQGSLALFIFAGKGRCFSKEKFRSE